MKTSQQVEYVWRMESYRKYLTQHSSLVILLWKQPSVTIDVGSFLAFQCLTWHHNFLFIKILLWNCVNLIGFHQWTFPNNNFSFFPSLLTSKDNRNFTFHFPTVSHYFFYYSILFFPLTLFFFSFFSFFFSFYFVLLDNR